MLVSSIVAVSNNNAIGKNNQIPWYLPADLQYFKKTTLNHTVIMGRKCYQSIGRPLPKRTNIVITRDPFWVATGCVVVHSLVEALETAFDLGETEAFIIGGGEIYEQSIQYWDKLYLTTVDLEMPNADVFFPELNFSEWKLTFKECHDADEKNEWNYCFNEYEKIQRP